MNKFLKFLPIIFWCLSLIGLSLGYIKGSEFIQSRGSLLCLSCMGLEEKLEENENF